MGEWDTKTQLEIAHQAGEAAKVHPNSPGSFLAVFHFQGYAWDFLERLYARVADHLASHGIPTLVAYPSLYSAPAGLAGSAARPIVLDGSLQGSQSIRAMQEVIRRENVRVVNFIDSPVRSVHYLRLRRAGVRRIIVYDHTSGERTRPRGFKRAAKWLLARTPGIVADMVMGVSEYVARRQREVALIPPSRVTTVWNGIPIVPTNEAVAADVRAIFGLAPGRPVILCACRATPEKGVAYLFGAFSRLLESEASSAPRPALVYLGDGPQLAELKSLRDSLSAKDDIILAGYRPDAREIMQGADLCVIPSVWQDAFPLAVLEAMACGKPVIATEVGGIPEMITPDVHGLLVPPGDEAALAAGLRALLADPARAALLGVAARRRVAEEFTPERQFRRVTALVEEGFGSACDAVRSAFDPT